MIKARGGLLSHARYARGALLQQQAKYRSLSPSPSPFSSECSPSPFSVSGYKSPLSCRGFRGFLSLCGRENIFACTILHGCSQNGLKHHNILALWSFQSRNPLCDDASRLGNPKFLHTFNKGKLTTSELIKSVQLAKSTGSKSATSSKALVADGFSIEKQTEKSSVADEKGHGNKENTPLQEVKPSSEKPNEECTSNRGTGMMPMSNLIPPHVVDRGFLKKELFSKNQALQSNPRQQAGEVLQKNRQKGPNQRQNLPLLRLSSIRKDTADESPRVQVRRNGIKENWSDSSQALQMSSPGRNVAAKGSVKPRGLFAAGFEIVSSSSKADGTDLHSTAERQLAQHGSTVAAKGSVKPRGLFAAGFEILSSSGKADGMDLHSAAERQLAQQSENKNVARESCEPAGKPPFVSKRSMEGQFQQHTERERVAGGQHFIGGKFREEMQPGKPQESITLPGKERRFGSPELAKQPATERQLAQHGESTAVAAKWHDQVRGKSGKESQELSGSPASQRCTETQFQQLTESKRIGSGQHFVGGKLLEKRFERPQESMGLPGVRSSKVQCQDLKEHIELAGESTLDTMHLSTNGTAGMQPPLDNVRHRRQHGEGTENEGKQPFARGVVTEREFSWHQESTKSTGENGEIFGKQPFHRRLPSNTQFWRPNEGVEFASRQPFDRRQATDTQFQVPRENHVLERLSGNTQFQRPNEGGVLASRQLIDRKPATDMQFEICRDSGIAFPGESRPAAPRKPFDRNKPRRKCKNELKEKDLSVQPIVGEPHYEYILRRKRVRAEAQKALVDDVDDYAHVGDDWVRKRLGWLCKEIPVLKASGLVKMLNNQRKWIKQEHLVELIEHLVRYMELNRAHRVLKWMQHQPLYKFEYELHNNMAYILGRNDKLSRCQDVFDEIVRNGKFPDGSVFTALIKAYLTKGDHGDINDAWKLYNQMLQLDLKVSPNLCETLLKSLTCPSGQWIRQAEELLVKMRASEIYINEEMYTRVIDIYGKRGDHKKVDALIAEMKNEHLETDVNVLNASLAACVKDGDTRRAENTYRQMIELGLKPNWHTYAYLIQVYGKAKLPMEAWEIFEKMKGTSIPVNFVTYHAIIEAMAADGLHVEQVMQVLTEVEECGIKPLQPVYNSIMNMYLKLKRYEDVESIFNRGKAAKVRPAHAAYNMLLKSYTDSGQLEKAEGVFQEMKATEGMGPNTHTYNILLEGYGVGCFKVRVRELFEEMSAKGCQLDSEVMAKIKSMVGVKKIVELEKKKLKLTDEQREIIPGLLLGGAKMESPDRNRTYELHLEFNCENQVTKVVKDHLSFLFQAWWKQNEIAASTKCEGASVEASVVKSLTRLETVSHGSLRFYAHQYRPNGEPIIPKLIHRWLKPRTLAYWYMYGGRKCRTTGGIVLNASKYSGKQIQLVVKALKARTMDCRRKKKRNGDVIRFEGKSALWLWKLMEPHILKAVREQLKPEEIPVNLDFAEGNESWESHNQASSDEDDWDDLEAEKDEAVACT